MEPLKKEYPQLKLQQKTETLLPIITAEIYIYKKETKGGWAGCTYVHYADRADRNTWKKAGLTIFPYDLCIPIQAMVNEINWTRNKIDIKNHENKTASCEKFPYCLPAKYLWNLTTNSSFYLTIHEYPVKMICKKNPKIDDKEFHLQFEERMEHLYKNPSSGACQPIEHLVPNEIFIKTDKVIHPTEGYVIKYPNKDKEYYIVGKNGIANEQQFTKKIAQEKINTSYFKALKQRELTGSFKK
jgi:hypothetical protein